MASIAMVTGATAGIGEATALRLAAEGYDIILTGRRRDRLDQTAAHIREACGRRALPLCFDVRDRDAVAEQIAALPPEWQDIEVLVNNAGLALGKGTIQEGDIDDWDTMIDTNVKGLLYVTRAVLPGMCDRNRGHIFNIGSLAGKEVYPGGNVYCGTKHAVRAISEGIRLDAVKHGIRVTNVAPGLVETEFSIVRFKGDTDKAEAVYHGYEPLIAEDIAEVIAYAAGLPEHVCLNNIDITCTAQASSTVVVRD